MSDDPKNDTRPALCKEDVASILENFDISADCIDVIKQLDSYDDQNFYIKLRPDGREVLLKVTNWQDSNNTQLLGETTDMMLRLSKSVPCNVPRRTTTDSLLGTFAYREDTGVLRYCKVRLFDFLPGEIMQPGTLTRSQAFQWGALLGRMHLALDSLEYPTIVARSFLWSWEGVTQVSQYLNVIPDDGRRALVKNVLNYYERTVFPRMKSMKRHILHGDLNERNILLNSTGEVYAVLDFGDCQGGPRVWDVAVMLSYISLVLPDIDKDLVDYFGHALAGYAAHMPDVVREHCDVETLRALMCARLCQSLTLGLCAFEAKADPYVLTSQARGWPALMKFHSEPRLNIVKAWTPLLAPYQIQIKEAATAN